MRVGFGSGGTALLRSRITRDRCVVYEAEANKGRGVVKCGGGEGIDGSIIRLSVPYSGYGGVSPVILQHDIRYRLEVSFTTTSLCAWGHRTRFPFSRKLVGSSNRSACI